MKVYGDYQSDVINRAGIQQDVYPFQNQQQIHIGIYRLLRCCIHLKTKHFGSHKMSLANKKMMCALYIPSLWCLPT